MNIKKGEMKMEMESQEGKTERLRAEWGQEGGETREGVMKGISDSLAMAWRF